MELSKTTPERSNAQGVLARVMLAAVAIACVAGEVGLQLQLQQHEAGWDALSLITLGLPVIALALILGMEHGHGDLHWLREITEPRSYFV